MFDMIIPDTLTMPDSLRTVPEQSYVYYMKENETLTSQLDNKSEIYKIEITMDYLIADEVKKLGYTIANFKETTFEDMNENFIIYTVELTESITNYSDLLQKEKSISKLLNLYDNNMILELI